LGEFVSHIGVNPQGRIMQMDFTFSGRALNGVVTLYSYSYPNVSDTPLNSYEDFTNWAVGNLHSSDNFLNIDNADGGSDRHLSFADLELTRISEVAPSSVPEPSSIALLALGLLFMTVLGVPKKLMSR
jgi:hypothetical protein